LARIRWIGFVLVILATWKNSPAADVTVSLSADVSGAAPAGGTLAYEIHVAITNTGTPPDTQGLCHFVLELRSDLGVAQSPLDRLAGDAAGFDGITPQLGTPDGAGGLRDIAAAQPCVVTEETILGVGRDGNTLVATGRLNLPSTAGVYRVEIVPVQILLINAAGNGEISPEATTGSTLTVTVGSPGDPGDNDNADGGEDNDNTDAGTDGQPGDENDNADAGTDGPPGDENENSSAGTDGMGTDGPPGDENDNGQSGGGGNDNSGGGGGGGGGLVSGLCGAGLVGPLLLGVLVLGAGGAIPLRRVAPPRPRRADALDQRAANFSSRGPAPA